MENFAWILWTVSGVVLIIAEIFTLGFVLFWFGIGAFAAALAAYAGLGVTWQFLIFGGVSVVFTLLSRTIFDNYYPHTDEDNKSGIELLPGKIGSVMTASRGALNASRVNVYGSSWKALPDDGMSSFEEGEKVEVVRVEGSRIFVRSVEKALPGWRDEEHS